jgi:hypothetical protein
MSKIKRFAIKNEAGEPLTATKVMLSECGDLNTNDQGLAQFLVESSPALTLKINGVQVWAGASDELKSLETFTQSGTSFVRS